MTARKGDGRGVEGYYRNKVLDRFSWHLYLTIIRGKPEQASNTWETGSGVYLFSDLARQLPNVCMLKRFVNVGR